ncbi:MAG: hypothetical protein ACQES9_10925 [Myxococcota bacterium]
MLNKFFLLLISSILLITIVSCDDDSESETLADKCDNICQKEDECDENSTQEDLQSCIDDCNSFGENMLSSFLNEMNSCAKSTTCADYENNEDYCFEQSQSACTTDITSMKEGMCTKQLVCSGIEEPTTEEIDQCVANMDSSDSELFECFTEAAISDYISCLDTCECENFEACNLGCMETELGINFSDDVQPAK